MTKEDRHTYIIFLIIAVAGFWASIIYNTLENAINIQNKIQLQNVYALCPHAFYVEYNSQAGIAKEVVIDLTKFSYCARLIR